jgi:RimJ/RimL family protein N-acetyltransferase
VVHETTLLRFFPICEEHAPLLVDLDSDPEVKRFIDDGKASSISEVCRFISSSIGHRWIARLKPSDEFVGWFGLVPTGPKERELGYRLRRAYWGQGLATHGALAALDHAFNVLDADRVWAQAMTVNLASRRVLEKAGLAYVRTFFGSWPDQIEGSDEGDVEYEMLRCPLAAH